MKKGLAKFGFRKQFDKNETESVTYLKYDIKKGMFYVKTILRIYNINNRLGVYIRTEYSRPREPLFFDDIVRYYAISVPADLENLLLRLGFKEK